jgi:hypothetical protein
MGVIVRKERTHPGAQLRRIWCALGAWPRAGRRTILHLPGHASWAPLLTQRSRRCEHGLHPADIRARLPRRPRPSQPGTGHPAPAGRLPRRQPAPGRASPTRPNFRHDHVSAAWRRTCALDRRGHRRRPTGTALLHHRVAPRRGPRHGRADLPWNSGWIEGRVNVRMIKRRMFGRARPDQLDKRVLLRRLTAPRQTHEDGARSRVHPDPTAARIRTTSGIPADCEDVRDSHALGMRGARRRTGDDQGRPSAFRGSQERPYESGEVVSLLMSPDHLRETTGDREPLRLRQPHGSRLEWLRSLERIAMIHCVDLPHRRTSTTGHLTTVPAYAGRNVAWMSSSGIGASHLSAPRGLGARWIRRDYPDQSLPDSNERTV